jgi:hypothetical protein
VQAMHRMECRCANAISRSSPVCDANVSRHYSTVRLGAFPEVLAKVSKTPRAHYQGHRTSCGFARFQSALVNNRCRIAKHFRPK